MKKKDAENPLKQVEKALQESIGKIEKIEDAGERLLAYSALKKALTDSYDPKKAKKSKVYEGESLRQHKGGDGAFGFGALGMIGAAGGTAALIIASGAVTFGVGSVVGGVLAVAYGTRLGSRLGRRFGNHRFDRSHTEEEKFATRMYEMGMVIDKAVKKLTSTDTKNMEALSRSAYFEDVKKEFPKLAEEFNRQAQLSDKQQKLLDAASKAVNPQRRLEKDSGSNFPGPIN